MNAKIYKQQLLNELYAYYDGCKKCPLFPTRTNIVFGEGNPDTKLLFIGEAPGKDEDLQGRPFVGRSGKLLTKTLNALGIDRQDIYITNVVKCRPPNNRLPNPQETFICKNLLLYNQIKIIRPKIICTLGSCALQALLQKPIQITKVRGTKQKLDNVTIIPTYHPAYILRNPKELKTFASDISKALKRR